MSDFSENLTTLNLKDREIKIVNGILAAMEYLLFALLIISVSIIGTIIYRKIKKNKKILFTDENCINVNQRLSEMKEEVTLKEYTPTSVKEEIPEERKELFARVWDSKRLLNELLEVTELKGTHIYILNWDRNFYQIRCKRIISVIRAFKGSTSSMEIRNNSILLRNLISENCSDERIEKLISLIVEVNPEMDKEKIEEFFNPQRDFFCRILIFSILFRYKREILKLSTCWNNVGATNSVEDIAIDITKKLYKEKMKDINDTLDKLLLLLLGDDFDKTITERELLEKYDYPNVTDEELRDIELGPWGRRLKSIESD